MAMVDGGYDGARRRGAVKPVILLDFVSSISVIAEIGPIGASGLRHAAETVRRGTLSLPMALNGGNALFRMLCAWRAIWTEAAFVRTQINGFVIYSLNCGLY
jgi:hypothetical protein